jgi:hypothetical protein
MSSIEIIFPLIEVLLAVNDPMQSGSHRRVRAARARHVFWPIGASENRDID